MFNSLKGNPPIVDIKIDAPNLVACTWLGYPTRKKGQITTLSPCPPEGGPKSAVFPVPQADWMVARLLLSGDAEHNPGPGKRWQCSLCSQHITPRF